MTNDKPKLLIAVDTYYPKIDGTLKFVEEFVKRANKDFDYHLLVPNFQKKKDKKDITFLDVSKIIVSSGYASIKISYKNIKKIKKAVKETDLVFAQGPALISFFALLLSKLYKKKCVGYMHINLWAFFDKFLVSLPSKILYHILRPLAKHYLNACSLIMIPYPQLREELEERGVKTEIKVARLGVDIEKFSPTNKKNYYKKKVGIDENKFVIGYVGRISKEKNIDILLKAFERIESKQQSHLLIVGDGPKEQVKPFKKKKNCTVTGFVNNVQDYLKAVDLFVMPSHTETTSLATLEAMSTGLPVIASKVGFMNSYIVRNHNGIFFPRNSDSLLAIKIEKLMENQELRKKLGQNARKTIAYSFSWERSINRIKRLLLQM